MKHNKPVYFIILLIMVAIGQWLAQQTAQNKPLNSLLNISSCDPTRKSCPFGKRQEHDKQQPYSLKFSQVPSALTPFNITVMAHHPQLKAIAARFEMDNMNMGFNQYQLAKNAQTWQAKVILPACALSRHDWLLKLKLTFEDSVEITKFKFILPSK